MNGFYCLQYTLTLALSRIMIKYDAQGNTEN